MLLSLLAVSLASAAPDPFNGTWRGKADCDIGNDVAVTLIISGGPHHTIEYRIPRFGIRGVATRRATISFDPHTNELPHPVKNGLSLVWPHEGWFSVLVGDPIAPAGGTGLFTYGAQFKRYCAMEGMQRVG